MRECIGGTWGAANRRSVHLTPEGAGPPAKLTVMPTTAHPGAEPKASRRHPLPLEHERRAAGRAARDRIPREALGRWEASTRGHDPLETILAQNGTRLAELLPLRHGRMAASPWTYYRGAAAVMANDLASRPHTGRTVQLCGDAHILNYGLWATPERQLGFDLRDFDETLPGPFEWDVVRLVTSIHVLARDNGVDAAVAERAVAACLRSYRERIGRYTAARQLDIWYDRVTVDELVGLFRSAARERVSAHIAKRAKRRTSRGAVRKLTEEVDGHLRITEEPPLRTRLDEAQVALADEIYAGYRRTLRDDRRVLLDRFRLVDEVRQVVGVGMRVFLALLEGRDGADPLFLQFKQAGPSVYEAHVGASRHANAGERVVAGKRLIQSATDIFVGWTTAGGHAFYVRQFRDMKVIPSGELIAPHLVEFATACGAVLARSHARTGDAVAIAAYIGKGRRFDAALGALAVALADQNERDHRQLTTAIADGTVDGALVGGPGR